MRLAAALLLCAIATATADDCGGTNTCGSWFSSMSCKGVCCHDDFNAWCCPSADTTHWVCDPTFNHDADHCNAPNSCQCTDTNFNVVKVEATGDPVPVAADDLDLTICCAPGAASCGFESTITYTQSQTLSWENTFTFEIGFEVPLSVEGSGLSITLTNTYTQGGSTTREQTISITSHCEAPAQGFANETFVSFYSSGSLWDVPVKYTIEHCGELTETDGQVQASVLKQNWDCEQTDCGCSSSKCCDSSKGCHSNAGRPLLHP